MAKDRNRVDVWSFLIIAILAVLDISLWQIIFVNHTTQTAAQLFPLKTPNASSSQIDIFGGEMVMAIDISDDQNTLQKLQTVLPSDHANYIDLAIISVPTIKDYSGLAGIMNHYHIGTIIYNGRSDPDNPKAWAQLLQLVSKYHIPLVTLGAGDIIHYKNSEINIVSPDAITVKSADLTETAIIEQIHTSEAK